MCHCCTWSHTSEGGEGASVEAGPTTLKPTEPNAESGRGREGGGGLRVWGARGSLTGRRSSPRCSACTCRSRGCRRARRDTAGIGGRSPRRRSRRRTAGRTWCRSSRARTSGSGPRPRCTAAGPCTGRIWGRDGRLGGARAGSLPPPRRPVPPSPPWAGPALTGGGSPGRRSRRGTAPGSTCPCSRARTRTCRPPGGSGRGSTGNNARSARRTCAPGTGSGRSAARTATCCRRTDCCSCGPTSPRGTGTRPSAGRSATWRCSSTRWRTAGPTSRARSDTRRSAGGTRRAGTGTHARSVRPSAARDRYTGPSRPRTARAGGRRTAPCSRDPRTGAGTLQEWRPGQAQALAREPASFPPGAPPPNQAPPTHRPASRSGPALLGPCPTRSALTGVAVGPEVAVAAAALAGSHAHLVLRARGVAFAHSCGRDGPRCPQSSRRTCLLLSMHPRPRPGPDPRVTHSPIPHSSPCCLQPAQHVSSWELQAERLAPESEPLALGPPTPAIPTLPSTGGYRRRCCRFGGLE